MKDTLDREINIGDIVCHANGTKYGSGAYVGRVIALGSQRVRVKFTSGYESSVAPWRLVIMRTNDINWEEFNEEEFED